jgi:hypothetical protein
MHKIVYVVNMLPVSCSIIQRSLQLTKGTSRFISHKIYWQSLQGVTGEPLCFIVEGYF